MTEKKISFGFKLVKKQPLLLPNKIENVEKQNDIEMIQCLEGQTIKVYNEKEKEKPLVIPLLNSQKTSTALASLQNMKKVLNGEDEANNETNLNNGQVSKESESKNLSLQERVVKELLAEANEEDGDSNTGNEKLTLPLKSDDKEKLEGAKQSSIDDYDRIPIAQFGMAMLRGMGVVDEDIKSKQSKEPELRPKGMGLGADKMVKKNKLLVAPAANEVLEIKKNACVRILAGKHKDLYGQIEGLDDHAGRVIVKMALGGGKEALNEFMVQPVSKQEYVQYGKVINSAKYEEYKRKQEDNEKKTVKKEKSNSPLAYDSSSRRNRSRERDEPANRQHSESNRRDSRDGDSYLNSYRKEQNSDRTNRRSRSIEHAKYKSKDSERNSYKNSRSDSRRSRSVDKYDNRREKNDKYGQTSKDDKRGKKNSSSKSSEESSSDSDNDRRHHKSHHSKKKHKKKSYSKSSRSKYYDSDEDERHVKKKTKKSKRERSRSRDRR